MAGRPIVDRGAEAIQIQDKHIKPLPPLPDNNAQDRSESSKINALPVNVAPPYFPRDILPSLPKKPRSPSRFRSITSVSSSESRSVTESIVYSHASSRTVSTEYGLFYTQLAVEWSPTSTPLGEQTDRSLAIRKKDIPARVPQNSSSSAFRATKSRSRPKIDRFNPVSDEDNLSRESDAGNSLKVSNLSSSTIYRNHSLTSTTRSSRSYFGSSGSTSRTQLATVMTAPDKKIGDRRDVNDIEVAGTPQLTKKQFQKLERKAAEMESTIETLSAELYQKDTKIRVYEQWVEKIKGEKKIVDDDVNALMDDFVLADYPMQIVSRLREIFSEEIDYFDHDDDL